MSSQPTGGCCCELALRLRRAQGVLSSAQSAEHAFLVKKVDPNDPSPPKAVHVAEPPHSLPPHAIQVSPSLPGDVFFHRHRMVQCVLTPSQAAEEAVTVQKVDHHAPPQPEEEDVQTEDEDAHHHPPRTVEVSVIMCMINN